MRRKLGNTNQDALNQLKTFALANPAVPIEQIALRSKSICGQEISYDRLKIYAERDPDGPWLIQRSAQKTDDVSSEVNHVRRIVYSQIVAQNEGGLLLTGDFDEQALTEMFEGTTVKISRVNPNSADAALINAYMNLLSKSNVNFSLGDTSGRSSREQVIEEARKALTEFNDRSGSVASQRNS